MSVEIPSEFVVELQGSGISEAVIVDDLFESPSLGIVVDLPGFWAKFCDNRAAHSQLDTIFKGVGNADDVQDLHIEQCWVIYGSGVSTDLLGQLFGDYPQRKGELTKLSQLLTKIFGKPTVELVPSATIPDGARLVFLDYFLGDDAEEAIKIAKKLAGRKDRRPYLVLISDSANLTKRSEIFRSDTGYIAGTFAHLEKEKAIDPAELAFALVSWGLGNSALRVIQPLFDAMISSVDEAAEAVKKAMAAVTIQDYSFLQNLSLSGDGHPLGEYIVDLFGASLSYSFRDSTVLKEARALADKTRFKKHLPLSMVPSHLVVELYREAQTEPLAESKIAAHPWSSEKTISVINETPESLPKTGEASGGASLTEPITAISSPLKSSQEQVADNTATAPAAANESVTTPESVPKTVDTEGGLPFTGPPVTVASSLKCTEEQVTASTARAAAVANESVAPPKAGLTGDENSIIQSGNILSATKAAVANVIPDSVPKQNLPKQPDENTIAWLSTGDIFLKDQSEPLLMVLNAGCDLQFAPNSTRKPQPDRSILLIEGTLYQISNLQPPDEIARTEYFKIGETLFRINWTDRVRTIRHADFKTTMEGNGYEKRIARLSLPYVLQVQQAWLASLGRVGVPVAPPHSGSQDIEIYTLDDKKMPILRKTVPHGVAVFRIKQTEGYSSEFLLSNETLTEVRKILYEMAKALIATGSEKTIRKAEAITSCLNNFNFWRALLEKPKASKAGTLAIENGILKASFNKSVDARDFNDTRMLLRFAELKSLDAQ